MSTPYEVALRGGMLLSFDRDTGGLRVTMRPYPTDEVLLSDEPQPLLDGHLSYEDAVLLASHLTNMAEIYDEPDAAPSPAPEPSRCYWSGGVQVHVKPWCRCGKWPWIPIAWGDESH